MQNSTIKITALGGQDEAGKSMYCVEIDNNIFILDAGYRFPELDKLGVDVIIPNYDYLKDKKGRVKAILISHGHDDVMGGLPYLLQEVNAPIYTTDLTADLIDQMLQRYLRHSHVKFNYTIKRVNMNASLNIAGVIVDFYPITHSIPGSVGIALKTNYGYIVYSSEFVVDFSANGRYDMNLEKIMEIGKSGVLALLCDSTYAKKVGHTAPNYKISPVLENIFEEAKGRIIVSNYAQNIYRTQEIVNLAKKYNRKVVFYGRDQYDNTNSLLRISKNKKKPILEIDNKDIAEKDRVKKDKDNDNLVIILSGSPTRIYHDILDIVNGGDENLLLQEGDTFIVASPVLPGTDKIANKAINELYKTDAKIITIKNKDNTSMHASQDDIKAMIKLFNPQFFIPVKGEYQDFIANSELACQMGIPDENVAIIDNGEIITFKNGKLLDYRDAFEINDIMIDGIGVGDVGIKVIDDRNQLQQDGVVIIGMTIDGKTKDIVANTDIQTRGFVYLKDSENIVKGIMMITETELNSYKKNPRQDALEIRNHIKDNISRFIYRETGKKPVVLPVIIEL